MVVSTTAEDIQVAELSVHLHPCNAVFDVGTVGQVLRVQLILLLL